MKNTVQKTLLIALLTVFMLPILVTAEEGEPDPNLPGNPECAQCHGTGKIEYGKKAGDTVLIEYCYYKDAKKRCPVIIGGWEPCEACEDWPQMQNIFKQHDNLVKGYRNEAAQYNQAFAQTPFQKLNFLCGKHVRVFTDADHSRIHGLVIWAEKNFKQFSEDFQLGGEGSDWEKMYASPGGKNNNIVLNSRDMFVKTVEWYYNSGAMPAETKAMGLETLKGLGGIWLGNLGRMTNASDQGPDQDERGIIKSFSTNMMYRAFQTAEGRRDPFPSWVTEGLSNYYQEVLRQSVTWYVVAYGQGNQRDREKWGSFGNWHSSLAEANKVPKASFDDRAGSWNGLIPMETLIDFRITNIPAQGTVQAWAMVHYFMGTGETNKKKRDEAKLEFKQFLQIVGSGVDQREALKQVYKVKDISSIETKFRLWLKKFAK